MFIGGQNQRRKSPERKPKYSARSWTAGAKRSGDPALDIPMIHFGGVGQVFG
jgi:hypothetical protein